MTSLRRWAALAAVAVAVLSAVSLALVLTASPASAFAQWQHDGAVGCQSCHSQGSPTDASCTGCHPGFESYPDMTCWSCHYPGQDTTPYWTTSPTPTASPTESPAPTPTPTETTSACSQECHLWNSVQKAYVTPTTHGVNPHLGSSTDCTACHATSVSVFDPGSSPHHSGQAPGFSNATCGTCHSSPQQHAGKVSCTRCHSSAQAFHTYQAASPGYKKCGSCHTMRHAGKKVSASRCAQCHKGSSGRTAQHSSSVTKKFVCSGCHTKKLHARAVSKAVKSCRTCHTGRYHAGQRKPPKSTCTKCHRVALRHDNGYQCTLCHRRALHAPRPSAVNL